MRDVVIAGACRSPIAKFQGSLARFSAPELGSLAIGEALRRAGLEAGAVEEVIFGNVLSAGLGQNPARQAAIGAGIPTSVGAFTVNKVCGSGLKAVMLAAQAVRAGDAEVVHGHETTFVRAVSRSRSSLARFAVYNSGPP